jgi:hypothetical protein
MLSSDNRERNWAFARKGIRIMTGKRVSIAQVMMLVALLAPNLAIARATPVEITSFPSIWVALGCLDFPIIWKLILRRSLRAFHYTFLIFFVITYVVMAYQVSVDRLHPLGFLVRLVQELAGAQTIAVSMLGYVRIAEFWAVAFLALVGACAFGWVAARLERRRHWDIAAFWRGVLVGFGIFVLVQTPLDLVASASGTSALRSLPATARLAMLLVCMIAGAWLGLSKLKSSDFKTEAPRIGSAV